MQVYAVYESSDYDHSDRPRRLFVWKYKAERVAHLMNVLAEGDDFSVHYTVVQFAVWP